MVGLCVREEGVRMWVEEGDDFLVEGRRWGLGLGSKREVERKCYASFSNPMKIKIIRKDGYEGRSC